LGWTLWYESRIVRTTMTSSVYPEPDEIRALVATPDSIVWQRSSDARGFAAAGYALLMQVAHPTVGAGVREHSDFASDPWGRLFRTLDFLNLFIYGGPQQSASAARFVRETHKKIKGTAPDGRRYHALEPEAYAWVHATLLEAIVSANQRFANPMTRAETERFYVEFRALGRLLGVRDRDLPETWAEFGVYFDAMVRDRLQHNDVVDEVLASVSKPTAPPVPNLPDTAWRAFRWPAGRAVKLATIGLLPPMLRDRFGLDWTARDERALRALGAASRAATPLVPKSFRIYGPTYLRWRSKEIDPALRSADAGGGSTGTDATALTAA
jgi:uncharacterized protein (DUF2236 family)